MSDKEKAAKPDKQGIIREADGKFAKGVCPTRNGGRKPMPKEFKELALAHSIDALKVCIEIMNDKKKQPKDRLKACEIVLERSFGKAPQAIVGGDDNDKPIQLSIESFAELFKK
jgi:hypothetical protein